MKILMWNIGGLGDGHKSAAIPKLLKEKSPDFAGLVETRHATLDERKIISWWNGEQVEWYHVEAIKGRGDLICCWKKNAFSTSSVINGVRWVCFQALHQESCFKCAVVVVYG